MIRYPRGQKPARTSDIVVQSTAVAHAILRGNGMNKLEARYADHLQAQLLAGRIRYWRFEALKLRLSPACFYDTDFLVVNAAGELEVHETKGFMRDDAAVKLKVAAEMYPFRFLLAKWVSGVWDIQEVGK